jgi:hypothetical protein
MNSFDQTYSLVSFLFGCSVEGLPNALETYGTFQHRGTIDALGRLVRIAKSLRFAKDTNVGVKGAILARSSVVNLCTAFKFAKTEDFVSAQLYYSIGIEFLKVSVSDYLLMLQELKHLHMGSVIELVPLNVRYAPSSSTLLVSILTTYVRGCVHDWMNRA